LNAGRPVAAVDLSARSVAAGNGSTWWGEGWRLFTAAPWVWIVITIVFVVIMLLLSAIPIIGAFATTLLAPVLSGGVLSGFRAVDRGGEVTVAHLFASFNDRLVPLVVVGLVYLVCSFLIVVIIAGIMVAMIGVTGLSALLTGDPMREGFAMLATLGIGVLLALLLGVLLGVPLMMAYWFAPALVVFRNAEPLAAMKASFRGSLINVASMLVYSLIGLVLAIAATIPFGLGWFVLTPVWAGSVYASYKDIYGDAELAVEPQVAAQRF